MNRPDKKDYTYMDVIDLEMYLKPEYYDDLEKYCDELEKEIARLNKELIFVDTRQTPDYIRVQEELQKYQKALTKIIIYCMARSKCDLCPINNKCTPDEQTTCFELIKEWTMKDE